MVSPAVFVTLRTPFSSSGPQTCGLLHLQLVRLLHSAPIKCSSGIAFQDFAALCFVLPCCSRIVPTHAQHFMHKDYVTDIVFLRALKSFR